jgi:hypothetical protein
MASVGGQTAPRPDISAWLNCISFGSSGPDGSRGAAPRGSGGLVFPSAASSGRRVRGRPPVAFANHRVPAPRGGLLPRRPHGRSSRKRRIDRGAMRVPAVRISGRCLRSANLRARNGTLELQLLYVPELPCVRSAYRSSSSPRIRMGFLSRQFRLGGLVVGGVRCMSSASRRVRPQRRR